MLTGLFSASRQPGPVEGFVSFRPRSPPPAARRLRVTVQDSSASAAALARGGPGRSALREAGEVGMRGDVAALHLVLADVLLGAGQDRQAEWEIRAALPIIEEEKMVPEGYAALSLLQESLRRRQIDRNALRNLHGYFRDPK